MKKENVFKKYFINILKYKYFDFNGVATRTEFWAYKAFEFLTSFALFFTFLMFASFITQDNMEYQDILAKIYIGLVLFWYLFLMIPDLAILVRRLHDINMSAWWLLLFLVPIIGPIIIFIFILLPTKEDNKYRQTIKESESSPE